MPNNQQIKVNGEIFREQNEKCTISSFVLAQGHSWGIFNEDGKQIMIYNSKLVIVKTR